MRDQWHYRVYFRKYERTEFTAICNTEDLVGKYYVYIQTYRVHDMSDYRMMATTKVYSEAWAKLVEQLKNEYPSIEFCTDQYGNDQRFKFEDAGDEAAFIIKNEAWFETTHDIS